MKNLIALMGFITGFASLAAQTPAPASFVTGIVTNEKEEILIGASVFWKDTKAGGVTDSEGRFSIPARPTEATLVVNYVGYTSAEVQVLPGEDKIWVEVNGIAQLEEVTVKARGFDTHISTLGIHNVERITSNELRKAPCCNLSESFQTNGAIDVSYPNALTGVKEIQLLGLRGIYSQFLVENRPNMTGIATPFAFEYYPGTWLTGVDLAKGASSVKNGNSGMTGQVNVELAKPDQDKPVFFNFFSSTEGRGEVNLHLNKKGETQHNGLLLHGSFVENRWDMNNDLFKDSPDRRQLNALYRWKYDGPAGCAQFNVHALTDRRQSGQMADIPGYSGPRFLIDQQNERIEAWGKYGKEQLAGRRFLELGNILGGTWHRNVSQFGPNSYVAEQKSLYWQTLFQSIIRNSNHKILLAPSVQYDDIRESVNEGRLDRREFIPGMMAEYTFSQPRAGMDIPGLVVVAGGRLDWNSRFGWQATPRLSAKYNFTEKSILRISAGKGYRSPNVIAENISLLASNRAFQLSQPPLGNQDNRLLGPEIAWNYGVNYTQNFKIAQRDASISVDLYRTDFVRQVLVDVEQPPVITSADTTQAVFFYHAPGKSFSNSLLMNFQYNLFSGFDIKLAFKWNDVRATFADGQLKTIPLVAQQRGLVSIDYVTPQKKWAFNTYVQIVGPQRLPDNSFLPHELTHDFPPTTPTFALWNAQVTRKFGKKFELYAGCENITGYQQHHVIIAADNPASPFFNGSQVWAPMMRQVGYLGIRWSPNGLD
ncbi:MAG: TonB-dependent receptor [Saprospiraceae bacterium]|nr:TonB-dependent receptor [Saprospiraceae bacterium]